MYWIEDDDIYIGASGPASIYSRIQQLGGDAGPNLSVEIPARKYLIVLDENRRWIQGFVSGKVIG